jgi:hypothetical protein
MPRLPTNIPRAGIATISPDGSTRFCRGMNAPSAANSE